jgi:hypothetical protein
MLAGAQLGIGAPARSYPGAWGDQLQVGHYAISRSAMSASTSS